MTLVQRLWDRAHGQHLAITATASGGEVWPWCGGLSPHRVAALAQLGNHDGLAISVLVISSLVLLIAVPPFLRLRGHVASLEEIMATTSIAERRRRRAEGDEAAAALGAGWAERWKRFRRRAPVTSLRGRGGGPRNDVPHETCEVGIAVAMIALLIGGLFLHTGTMPPLSWWNPLDGPR